MTGIENNSKSQFRLFFGLLVLLSAFMTLVYGPVYEHPGYDYYFHLTRFDALITALREGNFPFYTDYVAALGYGYLSKVFYSDIILLPFAILGVFTGAYPAYEVMLFTMTILCGLFMYGMVKTVFKNPYVALLAAILYTFSVYRLFDIYHRGALGEVFAFTFLPLIFWGLYYIIKGDYRKWYIIAIGFSLMIFSHVISTVLIFITVLIFLAVYYKDFVKEPKRFFYLALVGVVALAITSSYIFPLLEQIQSNTFRYEDNDWSLPSRTKLTPLYFIWALLCGFVFPKDIMIVGIGILLVILVWLRFFIKGDNKLLRGVDTGVFIGVFYLIASSSIFPWGRFPFTLLSFIQYPSRLFLFVTFFFAIAGAYYLSQLFTKNRQRMIVVVFIVLCTVVTLYMHSDNYKYMQETYITESNATPAPGNFFYLNGAEYVPERVESAYFIQERGDSIISLHNGVEVKGQRRDEKIFSADITVQNADSLELPLFYYKGYIAKLNGKEVLIEQSHHGLIQIPVDHSGELKVYYAGTTLQKVSWYITIVAVFALCIYIFVQRRKKTFKDNNNAKVH
ncbi:MFS family permease [Dysgonomonas sp. PFB1-18]|uniref:YfhO family protein n=1 Tax=unclassified Dysgonomonas TaxID=2630389 RepID=UPI00247587B8|nr:MULTISPECIES: YfhO family protein [unclassified Dysgonomonas]MDH6310386.1 MFS family permease [Dysgonomonas sp. PF1-14]MDH6340284.1 MFS family permease [Dysgonomonas sp. PF1-16]MDH6381936.1 MFS family permease [Dysgonomonas sp. PFB1-18]MDH6399255.1 MFS family permease [Dysgonomonas sp. PF1-23]